MDKGPIGSDINLRIQNNIQPRKPNDIITNIVTATK